MDRFGYKPTYIATFVFLLFAIPSVAAEFDEDNVLPGVTSLVFTQKAIAMTLQSPTWLGHEDKYFIADRHNYRFRQVSKQLLSGYMRANYYHRQFQGYSYLNNVEPRYQLDQRDILIERTKNKCAPDTRGQQHITHDEFQLSLNLKCASRILDAVRNKNELWVATFGAPYNYQFEKEGVVIASLTGEIQAQVDTGDYPILGLALDPWTQDVWVVSQERITLITEEYEVKDKYWPIHDFDETRKRPDTFVRASADRLLSDPLAIVAYGLGEAHYQKFYNTTNNLPDLRGQDVMYNYAMNGPDWSHMPQLPKQLNALIEDAEPTGSWRRFVCLLDDERAKELCNLDLDRWPAAVH